MNIHMNAEHTCLWTDLSLLFGRSMSELGVKEAERGGPEPDFSFFGDWLSGVRIWASEHLWSSIREP